MSKIDENQENFNAFDEELSEEEKEQVNEWVRENEQDDPSTKEKYFDFEIEEQKQVFALLASGVLIDEIRPQINPRWFSLEVCQIAGKIICDHYDRYKVAPSHEIVFAALRNSDDDPRITRHRVIDYETYIQYYEPRAEERQYLLDKVTNFRLTRTFREQFKKASDQAKKRGSLSKDDLLKIIEQFTTAIDVGTASESKYKLMGRKEMSAIPMPDSLVETHLDENCLAIINGKEGSCKTYYALEMGLAIAGGLPFLDKYRTKQANVLYILSENQETFFSQRIAAWEMANQRLYDEKHFQFLPAILDLEKPEFLQELFAALKKQNFLPKVIFIDTLGLNLGCSETDMDLFRKAIQNCNRMRQLENVTFVFLTHTPKEKPHADPIGDSYLIRHAKFCWQLVAQEDETDEKNAKSILVYRKKGKDQAEPEPYLLALQSHNLGFKNNLGQDQYGLTLKIIESKEETGESMTQQLLAYVSKNEPVPLETLCTHFKANGYGAKYKSIMDILKRSGHFVIEKSEIDLRKKIVSRTYKS